jgi:hypothetical protein
VVVVSGWGTVAGVSGGAGCRSFLRRLRRLAGVLRNLSATRSAAVAEVVDRLDDTLRIPL